MGINWSKRGGGPGNVPWGFAAATGTAAVLLVVTGCVVGRTAAGYVWGENVFHADCLGDATPSAVRFAE